MAGEEAARIQCVAAQHVWLAQRLAAHRTSGTSEEAGVDSSPGNPHLGTLAPHRVTLRVTEMGAKRPGSTIRPILPGYCHAADRTA